jgi:elongation factor Ts
MAEITIEMIKTLRDRTGIGMNACKQALVEAGGDMEAAITNLRKAGMASAVKKEARTTNEGQIGFAEESDACALVEVNAETDFVVKNDRFQDFVMNLAKQVAKTKPDSLEELLKQPYDKESRMTIEEFRASLIQTIGENIQIRRVKVLPKRSTSSFGIYSHLGGKIAVVVEIEGSSIEDKLAKDIAMHIAAANPSYLSPDVVPAHVIEHEKEIAKSQIAGKPDNVKDKIVEGKIQAYYKENCLTEQPYIRDDKVSIKQVVANRSKELGNDLKIASFLRWDVGK